jgi:hypothetical protein
MTGYSETSGPKREREIPALSAADLPSVMVLLEQFSSVQTAAVRMFLRFFGSGILAFEIGKRHV